MPIIKVVGKGKSQKLLKLKIFFLFFGGVSLGVVLEVKTGYYYIAQDDLKLIALLEE
jgi:hypothetical protein